MIVNIEILYSIIFYYTCVHLYFVYVPFKIVLIEVYTETSFKKSGNTVFLIMMIVLLNVC